MGGTYGAKLRRLYLKAIAKILQITNPGDRRPTLPAYDSAYDATYFKNSTPELIGTGNILLFYFVYSLVFN